MLAKKPYQKRQKRIGRGVGSGHGKTSTKGHKGQRARSGFHMRAGFEGGQNPLYRQLPKRGFNRPEHKMYAVINLDTLSALQESVITPEKLRSLGIVKKFGAGLKILGRGKLSRAITVSADQFSVSAKKAIEKAGGKAILINANGHSKAVTASNPSKS